MKRKTKKAILVSGALVVAAMMVTSVGSSLVTKTFHNEGEKRQHTVVLYSIDAQTKSLAALCQPKILPEAHTVMSLGADIQITSELDEEGYPSIAIGTGNNLVAIYDAKPSVVESQIRVAVSQDGGETWPIRHVIGAEGFSETPWVASRGYENRAVATWRSVEATAGNPFYLMEDITDPGTWSGAVQDWGDFEFFDFYDHKIAGYYWEDYADQFWGVEAFIGSTDYNAEAGWDCRDAPMLFLDIDPWIEGNVGINWQSDYSNSRHPTIDIDQSTGVMYSGWETYNESTGNYDMLLWMDECENFWAEEDVSSLEIIPAGLLWSHTYPSINAEYGHAYVVFQSNEKGNEDILCVHSTDRFETYEITTVVDSSNDELYPSIIAYGDSASCAFYKNGNLYVSHTNDAGVTWSEPEQINDQDGTVVETWRTAQITDKGNVVWTDNRNGNADVYYDNVGAPGPILSIESVSGGFGVKATVANVGTADVENVEWSMVFDGPVFIGKEMSGIVSIPAGGEATIKSGFIFGLGSAAVTVTVGGASKTASGFVLGPLVLGVK